MVFDPRTMGKPVYEALDRLRALPNQDDTRLKEQKNQAVELYTYLSTWGMLRLKAEENALILLHSVLVPGNPRKSFRPIGGLEEIGKAAVGEIEAVVTMVGEINRFLLPGWNTP